MDYSNTVVVEYAFSIKSKLIKSITKQTYRHQELAYESQQWWQRDERDLIGGIQNTLQNAL